VTSRVTDHGDTANGSLAVETPGSPKATASSRRRAPEDLLRTAERLVATYGIDGVSLRQIAVEAGHRNPGAVQYHFGSKEGLLQAIVQDRLPWINERRMELLARLDQQGRDFDIRGLVEVMARPFLEMDPGSHYVQLLVRLSPLDELLRQAYQSSGDHAQGSLLLGYRLEVALGSLPPVIRANRIRMARHLMLGSIAGRRAQTAPSASLAMSDELFALELYNGMVGLFGASHPINWPDQRDILSTVHPV
jgi:AcrR family transcriptional regulator